MNLKRVVSNLLKIGVVIFITSCSFFMDSYNEPVKEFFKEYTESSAIMTYSFDGDYPTNSDGITCLPSGEDRTVTLTMRNPQGYSLDFNCDFVYPDAQTAANSYPFTFTQEKITTIKMVIPKEFLHETEYGKDITSNTTLIQKDVNRQLSVFNLPVISNTAPEAAKDAIVLVNSENQNNETYVLCFNMPGTTIMSDGYAQKDIDTVTISGGKNGKKTFYVKKTNGAITFCDDEDLNISASLLTTTKPTNLDSWKSLADIYFTSSTNTASAQSVYYITGDPKNNAETVYTITVSDSMLSTSANISSKAIKIGAVSITRVSDNTAITNGKKYDQDTDSDVMAVSITPPATSTGNGISADTSDATIFYTITRDGVAYSSGSKKGGATVKLAPGKYTITVYAQKSMFIDSDTTTVTNVIVTASRVYVNEEYTGTSSDGTKDKPFTKLQDAVDIVLGNDTRFTKSSETSPAEIDLLSNCTKPNDSKNLVDLFYSGTDLFYMKINGNAHTIDAYDQYIRVMYVYGSKLNLSINKLTMTGGNTRNLDLKSGGAICNYSSAITLNNCTIDGCSAVFYGGAINNEGTMTLNSCTITNCTASSNSSVAGGAINNDGTMTLKSSKITNCTAYSSGSTACGGAIYNSGTMTLCLDESSDGCEISDCTASSDNSSAFGGAIYNNCNQNSPKDFSLKLENCNIEGIVEAASGGYGGAIYNINSDSDSDDPKNCTATFTNCEITGTLSCKSNNSAAFGGAVYNFNKESTGECTSSFTDCTITGSASGKSANGGAICNYTWNIKNAALTKITLDGCTITGSASGKSAKGGAIYNSSYGTVTLSGNTINDTTIKGTTIKGTATATDGKALGAGVYISDDTAPFNISGKVYLGDVYLSKDSNDSELAYITVAGDINIPNGKTEIATITPNKTDWINQTVLKGTGNHTLTAADCAKFAVPSQTLVGSGLQGYIVSLDSTSTSPYAGVIKKSGITISGIGTVTFKTVLPNGKDIDKLTTADTVNFSVSSSDIANFQSCITALSLEIQQSGVTLQGYTLSDDSGNKITFENALSLSGLSNGTYQMLMQINVNGSIFSQIVDFVIVK